MPSRNRSREPEGIVLSQYTVCNWTGLRDFWSICDEIMEIMAMRPLLLIYIRAQEGFHNCSHHQPFHHLAYFLLRSHSVLKFRYSFTSSITQSLIH